MVVEENRGGGGAVTLRPIKFQCV